MGSGCCEEVSKIPGGGWGGVNSLEKEVVSCLPSLVEGREEGVITIFFFATRRNENDERTPPLPVSLWDICVICDTKSRDFRRV